MDQGRTEKAARMRLLGVWMQMAGLVWVKDWMRLLMGTNLQ